MRRTVHAPFTLDPTRFVVIGDGLAAGAGDFGLSEELQALSFPALAAQQIGTSLSQPLIEAPGIGPVVGFRDLPVCLPQPLQITVLKEYPPTGPFANLSIPGLKLVDALTRRPVSPLIHRSDGLQTAINLVLGLPGLLLSPTPAMPTQVESAVLRQPTLVLIALGVFDIVDAALKGDASWIPDDVSVRLNYGHVLAPFGRMPATIVACTLPDPADMAVFTRVADAPRIVKADAGALAALVGVDERDYLTPAGLVEAGCRTITRTAGPLPDRCVVPAAVVARISERTAGLNAQIRAVAAEHEALLLDLHALFARLKREGLTVGGRHLTMDYLGGLLSLNGVSPGATLHGAIANEFLRVLNGECGTSYESIDVARLAAADPTTDSRLAPGRLLTTADLASDPAPVAPRAANAGDAPGVHQERGPISLPPALEATLELNDESSYVGDAWRAAPANPPFGGLLLTHSHVRGRIHIAFTDVRPDTAHFDLSFGSGLEGQDSVLGAPQFFKLPSLMNRLTDVEGFRSHGDVDLATGEVSNLTVAVAFTNSAWTALASINSQMPRTILEFSSESAPDDENPHSGSGWAKFEPRADGTLDLMFSGAAVMPLGAAGVPLRVPLPFSGPEMTFASIPATGGARYVHLCLSTKAADARPVGSGVPRIPRNTVREYPIIAPHSPHLPGRLLIQFGERAGNSVPFAVAPLMPGGMFAKPMADDPFAVSVGSVDIRSGQVLGPFLFRRPIIQDRMRGETVEPHAAARSVRGSAAFETDASGQTAFRFHGATHGKDPDPRRVVSIHGVEGIAPPPAGKSGAAHGVLASNGQRFSYKYHIPGYPSGRPAAFEYTNETQAGTFRMAALLWVGFTNVNRSVRPGECDCVTFTGIGVWSPDRSGSHLCTVQISTAPEAPYVSIQLDGGALSSVNTTPAAVVEPGEVVQAL